MTVRWTVRAADRNRRNDLSAKLTEGLTTPPSKIKDFAHLPLHRGGFGAVQTLRQIPILRTVRRHGRGSRLPLMRELSAKLTEGEILNSQIYVFTYTAEIAVNIQITDSDHC